MTAPAKIGMTGHQPSLKIEAGVANRKPIDPSREPLFEVDLTGEQVKQMMGITEEKEKYLKCWDVDEYRAFSPGEENLPMFLEAYEDVMEDDSPLTLIDWGCGTGRASLALYDKGFDVTMVDFAINCLDEKVADAVKNEEVLDAHTTFTQALKFVEHDITKKIKLRSQFGYCCDVMEHLPPDQVDDALEVILENSRNVFFQICTTEDHFGKHPAINHPLHLSVHGYQWWLKKLVGHGCIIHRSIEKPGHVMFFVTGYTGFSFDKLSHNTDLEEIHEHIIHNATIGAHNLKAHEKQDDVECVVIGGGPSLNNNSISLNHLLARKLAGEPIHFVTMNGSYKWAHEHGYTPCTQFMIDARAFNKRFVSQTYADDKYVIASQCHPELTEYLPPDQTYLWQVNITEHTIPVIEEHYGKMYEDWFPCPGGSSVMLRTLPALQMMGFRKIHIFGFDSCVLDEEHHAYQQKENEVHPASIMDITPQINGVEPRTFRVHPWMLAQAKEFMDMKHTILRHLDITIYGDGLVAYLDQHDATDALLQE
jgi:hypothetical protein